MKKILLFQLLLLPLTTAISFAGLYPEFYPGWLKYENKTQLIQQVTTPLRVDEAFTEPKTGMKFVSIEGGCYQMGSNNGDSDEKPVHQVCVDGYYIGQYEVTQGQWQQIMGNNPSSFKNGSNYPVEKVSWNDVQSFIQKLNSKTTTGSYRLPTEAEWEYAASGGQNHTYAGSNTIGKVAWYTANSGSSTHAVGQKQANRFGLYDMSGNVWEWCNDWFGKEYYKNSSRNNPQGPSSGSNRVLRGGSWVITPPSARAANRNSYWPDFRNFNLGFRLVFSPRG